MVFELLSFEAFCFQPFQQIIVTEENPADRSDAHGQDDQEKLQPFQDTEGSEQRGKDAGDDGDDPALRPEDVVQGENRGVDVAVIGGPLGEKQDQKPDKTQPQVWLGDDELRELLVVDSGVHGQNRANDVEEGASHHGYECCQEDIL